MAEEMIAECFDDDVLPKELVNKMVGNVYAKITIDGKKFEKALKNLEVAFDDLNKAIKEFTNKDSFKIEIIGVNK